MPVVRYGDTKRINIVAGNQIAKIVVLQAIGIAVFLMNLLDRRATPFGVDVTDGDDPAVILLKESLDVPHPHTAQANHAHRQSIARTTNRRRKKIRRYNSRHAAFEKSTPCDDLVFSFHSYYP